ncbi:transketolase [Carnobacteriaceae bacterium zg-ZUI252]|nr:transketolase [Carnobacteriaceae bacterium zg-ZUI252]MBS4769620.1 transketolase [Carnobacteriaceae bacterium zg-ZUI240]
MTYKNSVNAIRFLGVDAINQANSGHPGIVLGAAPMTYALYANHMNINPSVPEWFNRDRFVLSAGHGSALLYALLHLTQHEDVTIDELKKFRQLHSKTPGHPEFGYTRGVDATSGPLGQGISTAVGMALAERYLAAHFNQPNYTVVDHYTYAICGDGDFMEGVSAEASSFAAQQKLGKLVVLYDSNDICLDGKTEDALTENVRARYDAYGWHTQLVEDGEDVASIHQAIENAKADPRPSLIEVKTIIGFGSPKQGTNAVHGAPLGAENTQPTREALGWEYDPFVVPEEVYADFDEKVVQRGKNSYDEWVALVDDYQVAFPQLAEELARAIKGDFLVDLTPADFPNYEVGFQQATRNSSQDALNAIASKSPLFLGGSADLAHSNMTYIKGETLQDDDHRTQRNIQFGVREFAMGCILNGATLHGGLRIYGGTFFVFSDYLKGAMRLAAIQKLPVTYVLTHDSIAVGEDGPTHEPIEHLAALRALPNMNVIRPADAVETQAAWLEAMKSTHTPTALVLSRQALPVLENSSFEGVAKGGYVIFETEQSPEVVLLASGSEVSLAIDAAKVLETQGKGVRVVSMPCFEMFDAQSADYKESVLPAALTKRFALEMGATMPWYKYVGLNGDVLGIDRFGESAPAGDLLPYFGFTVENVVEKVLALF